FSVTLYLMLYRWSLILLIPILAGCRKAEPTSWDSEWTAPLVTGRLDVSDLQINENVSYTVNFDNSITLVYEKDLISFNVGDLASIPDTTVVKKLTIPLPSINVPPGGSFFDEPQDFTISSIDAA